MEEFLTWWVVVEAVIEVEIV